MKLKKITAVLLAAAMTVATAACGGSGETKTGETGDGGSAPEEAGDSGAATGEEGEGASGETTKISFLTCQGKFKEAYRTMAEEIGRAHV